jgi:hypothetical protein
MKPITFSRNFPATHPRKGEPTGFADAIRTGRKIHTIRAGYRWKVGDVFEPREWTGAPYRSKQQAIGEPLVVTAVYEIIRHRGHWRMQLKTGPESWKVRAVEDEFIEYLAKYDGLTLADFLSWFPDNFEGQVICFADDPYHHLFG